MKTEPDAEEEEQKILEKSEGDDRIQTLSTNPTLCNIQLTDDDNEQPLETLFESITTLDSEFCDNSPVLEKKPSILCSAGLESSTKISSNLSENLTSTGSLYEEKGTQTADEFEKPDKEDFSVLQPPLNLGVKNVKQILTCIQSGSLEVQDIIYNECNIIYECKVCHNLFRCLANLLSHKRFYCKDSCAKAYDAYMKRAQSDVTMVIEPESPPELEEEDIPLNVDVEAEDSNPPTLTKIQISTPKIYTPISETKTFSLLTRDEEEDQDETYINLEHIKENRNAVYQTVIEVSDKMDDSVSLSDEAESKDNSEMSGEVPTSKTVLMTRERKLLKRSDCDIKDLMCLKCTMRFDSLKRLYIHMKTIHPSKRVYYPCIYCKASFIRLYGVTRHMMKSHQKTKDQVSRIRDLIKKRAFICKGPLPSDQFQEIGEPKTEVVVAPKLHSCAKCNRQFERKSSQISHEKFCRFGGAEPAPITVQKKKVLGTTGTIAHHRCIKCSRSFKLKSSQVSHSKFCKGNAFRKPSPKEKPKLLVSPTKQDLPAKPKVIIYKPLIQEECSRPKRDVKKKCISKDFVSSQSLKWRSANKVEAVSPTKVTTVVSKTEQSVLKTGSPSKKSPESTIKKVLSPASEINTSHDVKVATPAKSAPQVRAVTPQAKPPAQPKTSPESKSLVLAKSLSPSKAPLGLMIKSPQHPKSLSVNVIEGRMHSIINAQKLSCLKCSRRFSTFSNLKRHAATHVGWMRFKCKHCSYQCFNRSDCRSHIQRMHPDAYTSIGNLDRNIVKLATGKLTVRREDLMPDGTRKLSFKAALMQEVMSSTKLLEVVKLPKPVSSIVLKSGSPSATTFQTSPLPIIPKVTTNSLKEPVDVKPNKPVTSLVLKTAPTESTPDPPRVIKSSARKSTGGVPKRILKSSARKSTGGVPKKLFKSSARKSTGGVPKKIFKSSARKSTGGVPKKSLKTKSVPPSPTTVTPTNTNLSSSPHLTLRKKSSPSSSQATPSNAPPSPKILSRKKSSPSSPGSSPELANLPRSVKSEVGSQTTAESFVSFLKGSRKADVSPDTSSLEPFPKIISVVKPPKRSDRSFETSALETPPEIINLMKPAKKEGIGNESTSTKVSPTPVGKVINLLGTPKKGDLSIEPSSLEISPKVINILKTSKVIDVSSATTKPHVILLNSSSTKSKIDRNPSVYVLSSPRTRSDKMGASTTTLVTRAGTYTKTNLLQKFPVKANVKQRNNQSSSDCLEANGSTNSQLPDHQYT